MSSDAIRNLEEENKLLRDSLARVTKDKRKCDAEIDRLKNSLASLQLQLSSNTDSRQSQFVSKFAKEFTVSGILGIEGGRCVFETMNKLDEWKYAVKRIVVDPKTGNVPKILREVRSMAKLEHAHIIRYNSTWIEEPPEGWQDHADTETLVRINSRKRQLLNYSANSVFVYIQMQLCNYSLTSWLSNNTTQESRELTRMKNWFKQMVNGVDYIHDNKLIHRDLKPCNILFVSADHLKICDLGIVIEQQVEDGVEITMSRTGSGTVEYMSPEQRSLTMLNVSHVTSASDVFSLGLILAELCVVMDYDKKVKVFDSYRRGKPVEIFEDTRTTDFVGKLTDLDRKKRPTCKKILDEIFMS